MSDSDTFILNIPVRMRRTNGRVLMFAPTELWDEPKEVVDRKALTAIATAFHWQAQMDNGTFSSQRALAAAKGVHPSYVWKLCKLIFLDPYIIRQLLDGRQPSGFNISEVLDGGMPLRWDDQRQVYGFA